MRQRKQRTITRRELRTLNELQHAGQQLNDVQLTMIETAGRIVGLSGNAAIEFGNAIVGNIEDIGRILEIDNIKVVK